MASSLGTEADQEHNGSGYTIAATAHAVDKDSWQQGGRASCDLLQLRLCAYLLQPHAGPLGLGAPPACLSSPPRRGMPNWLLAGLHVIDGQRFIRYRDLMHGLCLRSKGRAAGDGAGSGTGASSSPSPVSTVLGVATTAAAVRLIFHNARVYHFFADM
ncbi:hypothetical protein C2845_PM13G16710 [Panicum miliaceum]|uniref:Uncharacterized protein n=1 Tax=Panicum miliaceum TaxID=4540 RepID=A0A3L6RHX2_PANMI|nr:hypothetical protein C2845_PM13G16710 [Panicum miliaceum]